MSRILITSGPTRQYLDPVPVAASLSSGESAWLSQLQQNPGFRTNIGLLNVGDVQARVALRLRDGAGVLLSQSEHSLEAGRKLQLQEPFKEVAGRTDLGSGYASIKVLAGNGVLAYASVIDNRTNDPTTVPMAR